MEQEGLSDNPKKRVDLLRRFADLCMLSLQIVKAISPDLHDLLKLVVRQYVIFVCKTCERELEKAAHMTGEYERLQHDFVTLANTFDAVESSLSSSLNGNEMVAPCWIDKTIYDVVYYALVVFAAKHDIELGREFYMLTSKSEEVSARIALWLGQARKFAPRTVCFNTESCIIGTTYARWEGWKLLEEWEKGIRDAGIGDVTRDEAIRAHDA